jgi:protoporphyrinogen oxidase
MGLMVALELLKAGVPTDIYEHDDRIGGMSASFDFDGLAIERYYHFICRPDQPMFGLLNEMGLSDRLRWVETKMGYYFRGKLHPWGTPQALLRFPGLDLVTKLRYAAMVMWTKNVSDWRKLDRVNVIDWLRRWVGERGYQVLWKSLFELKFHEHTNSISAAWLGTRIKRVGLSRKNLFTELLGYLEGGSEVLLRAMEVRIKELGGNIFLKSPVQRVATDGEGVAKGVVVKDNMREYDLVVSTIPIQYVPQLVPDLPAQFCARIDAIANIGVACVILKLRQRVTENFWVNINSEGVEIPGIIEYTNLNPLNGQHVLYAPYYMPTTHPKYRAADEALINETLGYLRRLNPGFSPDWVLASHVSRYQFAQTVCPPGFYDMLPASRTPVEGFWMADTAYYYPEDRSISESVRLGKELVRTILKSAAQ